MKYLKKNDIIAIALCLCGIIPGAVVYNKLPEMMTTNWNMNGEPGSTSPKAFVVFGIPLIYSLVMLICCIYLGRLDSKDKAGKAGSLIRVLFPAMFLLCQIMMILSALGKLNNIPLAACIMASVSMIAVGNYMPKVRKNWIIGIRTPHIVSDEEIWYKTHRFAGISVTIGGLVCIVLSLLSHYIAVFVILMSALLLPMLYGEALYYSRRKK